MNGQSASSHASALPKLLNGVLDAAVTFSGADFGNIQLFDSNGHLKVVAHRGLPDWWIAYSDAVTIGQVVCATALSRGERVIVEDVERSPLFAGAALDVQRKADIRAVQSTPLLGSSGQVLGLLSTHYRTVYRPDAKELNVIDLLAAHAIVLIEHTKTEAELRASEERLRRVSENADVGLTRLNRDLVYLSANAAYAQLAGLPVEEIVGRSMYEVLGKEGVQTIRPYVDRVLRGERVTYEAEVPFAGSGYRYLHVSYTPDADSDGRIVGWVASITDITEHRKIEDELRRYKESLEEQVRQRTSELRDAQRIASVGSWHLDLATDEVTWSEELYRMFNAASDVPPPKFVEQGSIFQADSWDRLSKCLAQTVATGVPYELELQTRRADETSGWILARGERVCNGAGTAVALRGIAMDITARKEAERFLRAATQAAEAANIAKSAFLANMSHEIRTPMNAIIGIAHLMRRAGVTPDQADQLNKIDAASQHLLGVINDILDLSKIEAGKMTVERIPIDVGKLVETVILMARSPADAKGLELVADVSSVPNDLLGDPVRFQQALLNFVTNAIKFTKAGTVVVRVRIVEDTIDHVVLRCEVIDSGVGIAPDRLERLFANFEQADSSTTRVYGGTGLGLVITRRLAELMGGTAGAESVLGRGSTFWFEVSLSKGAIASLEVSLPDANAEAILKRDYHGTCILLAEDEVINQEIACTLLQDCGLHVDVAGDGREAVKRVSENEYDLVLMDMQMPNMGGVEAAKQIRALDRRQMPILALTANALVEDRMACLEAGMNDFFTKPLDPERLFSTVLKWLAFGRYEQTASGKRRFVMDANLLLGVPEIDCEHEALLARLEYMRRLPDDDAGAIQFSQSLNDVGKLIRQHLESEEAYLTISGVPATELAPHLIAHNTLMRQVVEIQMRFPSGNDPDRRVVVDSIDSLLREHLLTVDLKMKSYLSHSL